MAVLYISEHGLKASVSGEVLLFKSQGEVVKKVPLAYVDRVMAFSSVQFTTQCLSLLAKRDVPVVIYNSKGRYLYSMHTPMGKNVSRRMKQYKLAEDNDYTIAFCRRIVKAKIKNASEFLRRYGRRHSNSKIGDALGELKVIDSKVCGAKERNELMGLEGYAARSYFYVYASMIGDYLPFGSRSRRPPKDPVNSLLSFGYTLLAGEIESLVEGFGCDPAVGFYHGIQYGRSSMALDLTEEFRSICIDRFILYLAGEKIFTNSDFEEKSGGCYLVKDKSKKFYAEYEKWMNRGLGFQSASTWRKLIRRQVERFSLSLDAEGEYIPMDYGKGDVCCSEL